MSNILRDAGSESPSRNYSASPNPPPSGKILLLPSTLPYRIKCYYVFRKKNLTEICRNMLTIAFKVLRKCSSWAARNGAVQMLNMSAGKFLKSERFLAVLQEHIIFNVKRFEVRKISKVFRAKLCCKMSDLFS